MNGFARHGLAATAVACLGLLISGANAQAPRLTNLSVRTQVDGNGPVIAGLTVGPTDPATVLLRAIGPSLASFGVGAPLTDPQLNVFDSAGRRIAGNDDFDMADGALHAAAGAFPLPAGAKDAALVVTLPAGSYTVHVSGAAGVRGEVLIEAYLVGAGPARLQNLSVRAPVHPEGGLITGITVSPGQGQRRLLVRAIGPTLGELGVSGAAAGPRFEIFNGVNRVAENHNWAVQGDTGLDWMGMTAMFLASGAFPLARISGDAAVVQDFVAGSYTIVTRAVDTAGSGVALVEIYEAPESPPGPTAAVAAQNFSIREVIGANFFLQVDLSLRVIATSPGMVRLRNLRFVTYEKGGAAINIRPTFALDSDVGPGVMVELLGRSTPQFTALYYEIDPVIDRVMAEVTYTDSTGKDGTLTITTPVGRR